MDQGTADAEFSAYSQVDGDHARVVVTGEVDMATVDEMMTAATSDGARRLTLDLRAVTFFDSAAIHGVVRLADQFSGALSVLPSRQVRRVLDMSGLGDQPWLADA